jgi:hypothetical protein
MNTEIFNTNIIMLLSLLGWFVFIITIFLILFFRFPLGSKWTNENRNPFVKETFAMPRGIMRSIITLSLLFVVLLIQVIYFDRVDIEKKIDGLMVAFQMMIAFYFGEKALSQFSGNIKKTDKEDGESTKNKENGNTILHNFNKEDSNG